MNVFRSLLIVVPILMAGCEPISKKQQGQAVGAVLGGIFGRELGDNTTSTIAGTILGGYIGGQLVEHWSQDSQQYVARTLDNNTDRKSGASWHDKGEYYVMNADEIDANRCRKFTMKVTDGAGPAKVYKGVACREVQQNGYENWVIVD